MDDTVKEVNQPIEFGTINLKFSLTMDEADAVINRPKSQIARKLRRYMRKLLMAFAQKVLDNKGKNVTKCELNVTDK